MGPLIPGELLAVISACERRLVTAAWWTERFARERVLKPLHRYIEPAVRKKSAASVRQEYEQLKSRLWR